MCGACRWAWRGTVARGSDGPRELVIAHAPESVRRRGGQPLRAPIPAVLVVGTRSRPLATTTVAPKAHSVSAQAEHPIMLLRNNGYPCSATGLLFILAVISRSWPGFGCGFIDGSVSIRTSCRTRSRSKSWIDLMQLDLIGPTWPCLSWSELVGPPGFEPGTERL